MQENNFFNKIIGKGELSIKQMQGFHSPDDEEHQYITQKMQKSLIKNIVVSSLMLLISMIFTVMYIWMYFRSVVVNKEYYLVVAGVFSVITVISGYKIFFTDSMIYKIIKNCEYKLRKAKIHHVMPGVYVFEKTPVKIQDENGNIYYYEFQLNRKMKRIYKKDVDTEFTIIELNKKKEIYCITYLPAEQIEQSIPPE